MKTQERIKFERYNIFTQEINKINLSSNSDKKMLSIDSIETYAYGMRKFLAIKKDEIK